MPFIEPHGHERHYSSKLIAYSVSIVMDESNNKHVKGYKRGSHDVFQNNYDGLVDNSSPSCWPIISLAKQKASLEASISIRKLPWTVTSSKPVINTSLFSFFFSRNMLRSTRYSWGTVESHVRNSSDSCGGRNTNRKLNCTESRNCISIIGVIKGGYVIWWGPSIRWNLLLKQSWSSRSDNSLLPINFS